MSNETTMIAILCGGKGVRLRPLSDQFPKAMAPVNGRPMLEHIFDFFKSKGFLNFRMCIGYKGEVVKKHFAKATKSKNLKFSDEGVSASMLQRLYALRNESFENLIIIPTLQEAHDFIEMEVMQRDLGI